MTYGLEIYNADGKVIVANGDKSLFLGDEYLVNNYLNSSNYRHYPGSAGYYISTSSNVNTSVNPHRCRNLAASTVRGNLYGIYDYAIPVWKMRGSWNLDNPNGYINTAEKESSVNNKWFVSEPKLWYMPVGSFLSYDVGFAQYHYYPNGVLMLYTSWNTGVRVRNLVLPDQPTDGYGLAAYDSSGTCTFNSNQALALFSDVRTFQVPKVPENHIQSGALFDWVIATETINVSNSSGWVSHTPPSLYVYNDNSARFRRLYGSTLQRVSSTQYKFHSLWAAYKTSYGSIPNLTKNVTFYAGNAV